MALARHQWLRLILCFCFLFAPHLAHAEWVKNYVSTAPDAFEDEYGDVVLWDSQFVPKNTLHSQDADQAIQCTLTWEGTEPAPRFIKVIEYSSAEGGGECNYLNTPSPTPTPTPIILGKNRSISEPPVQRFTQGRGRFDRSVVSSRRRNPFLFADAHHRIYPDALRSVPVSAVKAVVDDNWTFGACPNISFNYLDNDRGGVPVAAWFANLSTYRIVESLREVIYAVKEVGGVYTVQVKPCNLRANIGMSYSPYDSWIYTYTTYQVTVGELDVKPILETPEDLSIFRGFPRGSTPGPCFINIKGAIMAPREPRIQFTYEKVKIGDVVGANGITQKGSIPVTTDDFGVGSVAETKHEVPESELDTFAGGVKVKVSIDLDHPAEEGMHWYNFEAVWKQQLPRSLTKKFSSKKVMDANGVETDVGGGDIVDGPHYWEIRAEAIIKNEFGHDTDPIESEGVNIQIYSLAPPVDVNYSSGYGPRVGQGWTYAKTTDNHYVFVLTKTGTEQHKGYDYPVPAGQPVYAAQQGTLVPGPFKPLEDEPIAVDKADALWAFMKNYISNNASDLNVPANTDPNKVLLCVMESHDSSPEIRDTYIGPNWLIRSFKKGTQDEQQFLYKTPAGTEYKKDSLVPTYGHLQPSLSDARVPIKLSLGDEVELGEGIGQVGDWTEDTPKGRLSLGYIRYTGVVINLYRRLNADGTLTVPSTATDLKAAILSDSVKIGDWVENYVPKFPVAFPNTGGPHLHYEVRHNFVWENETDLPTYEWFDPLFWANVRLGVHRQDRNDPMNWLIKEILRSEEGSDNYAPGN